MDFFDAAINDCPYPAYAALRNGAPVWRDPRTAMYVLSRYEDVKMVLLDTERFSSVRPSRRLGSVGEAVQTMYREQGCVPAATLAGRDDPTLGRPVVHRRFERFRNCPQLLLAGPEEASHRFSAYCLSIVAIISQVTISVGFGRFGRKVHGYPHCCPAGPPDGCTRFGD